MATPQQYIQSMAQQASPFVPNNGNPNTVYNTAATPFGGTAGAWQDISPFGGTNINQHWSFAPAPTAVPMGAYADPSAQFWRTPTEMAPAQFNLDQSGAMWPEGGNPFMPTPNTPNPDTQLPDDPGIDVIVHPRDPVSQPRPVTGGGPSGGGTGGHQGGTPQNIVGINVGSALGGSSGTISSRPVGDISSGLSNLADSISRGMGFNGRDGKFDPMQFLDAITEVIIPGDFYNANVGRVNWPNVVKGALNAVIPGLGKVAEWLAGKLPDGNPIKEWLQQGQLQNLVDEAYEPESYMNAPQTSYSGGGGGGGGGRVQLDLGIPTFYLNDPDPVRYGSVGAIEQA
nr:MAG TPA_asm: hypothetical protein [Caudoviricetes sp.]